jgi:hypothetical protein
MWCSNLHDLFLSSRRAGCHPILSCFEISLWFMDAQRGGLFAFSTGPFRGLGLFAAFPLACAHARADGAPLPRAFVPVTGQF